jgi:hypothetical protein
LFPKFRNGGPIAGPEGTLTENRVLTIQLFRASRPPTVSILNLIDIGLEHIIGNEEAFVNVRRTFIAKLAALVPPPRAHLTRYHGVLGPAAAWRAWIVPNEQDPAESRDRPSSPATSSAELSDAPSGADTPEARRRNRGPDDPHPYVIGNDGVLRYLTVAEECAEAALVAERDITEERQ